MSEVDEVAREDGVVVVRLRGEIDTGTVEATAAELGRALRPEDSAMVVDLAEIEYIGSAGVRMLHELAARLTGEGRRLRLATGGSPIATRLLELVAMDGVVPVDASVDQAVAALATP
jgi:anti-anti-sigma factor